MSWVPEMVQKAGGMNLISKLGQKYYPVAIDQIVKSSPDIKRTLKEKKLIENIIGNMNISNNLNQLRDSSSVIQNDNN